MDRVTNPLLPKSAGPDGSERGPPAPEAPEVSTVLRSHTKQIEFLGSRHLGIAGIITSHALFEIPGLRKGKYAKKWL